MGRIRILPEHLANQIAAGEVVERSASVLKELVENSIDAGARRIQIYLRGQGRELIQVVDDGAGMEHDDLLLAFERHATSKIASLDDLFQIRSLGFRGEALPSVASVSIVEVRSRTAESAAGTLLRLEGGIVVADEPCACPQGTSVAVHSLFFNTPARAKFLKSATTEFQHILSVFKRFIFSYPDIAWGLFHNDAAIFQLPATDIEGRLSEIFGPGFIEKLLPIDYAQQALRIWGYLGKAELHRKSRGDQYIFLNKRTIQDRLIHNAVTVGLDTYLPPGEWPFYILFLEMDPHSFDVNVHPAKAEVKFDREGWIHSTVRQAVRQALGKLHPEALLPKGAPLRPVHPIDLRGGSVLPGDLRDALKPYEDLFGAEAVLPPPFPTPRVSEPSVPPASIWQVHNKYILSQVKSGVVIIDQHAAHERILFEKAKRALQGQNLNSQQLLFPLLLELSPEDDLLLRDLLPELAKLGFVIREFGKRAFSLEAVPA
ncbi:MAG: DNA mismatch repair endonuclease MutL, partial [Calditrichaeota bacterium]|nr:DNA mismatch repair endonuclease MutL [Calditrichota bacterium]